MHYGLKPARFKFICELCPNTEDLEQHRINPDGTYENSNVIIVCGTCHARIHRMYRNNRQLSHIHCIALVLITNVKNGAIQ